MKLVHGSDWHNQTHRLPPADLYVFTGDMLPNFPVFTYFVQGVGLVEWVANTGLLCSPTPKPQGAYHGRRIDHVVEADYQTRYLKLRGEGSLRAYLGSPNAPVVVCRGNHDFSPLAPWFGGDVYEVGEDPTVAFEVAGLKVGGFRGIPYIHGNWADELHHLELVRRAKLLPTDLDVVLTHAPRQGVLDEVPDSCWGARSCGAPALKDYFDARAAVGTPAAAHLFGHIHEDGGKTMMRNGTLYSNAATTWREIEL